MKAKEQRLLFFGFSLLTMQLSILIPTYNYVCTKLAKDLASQCYRCTTLDDYEIVVADDGSTDSTSIAQNRSINDIPHCRYAESAENIGRSRILHKMVLQMQFPWVIIIDSDAEVNSENFIKTYLENTSGQDVVCGGIVTSEKYKRQDNTLRYKYESKACTIRALQYREKHPYRFFSSFNILIRAQVFEKVNFDDALTQYGYEDTLFGIQLEQNNFNILHINNPLVHTGIDTNEKYLLKTEQALQNLVTLKNQLQTGSLLYQYYLRLQKLHLIPFLLLWHKVFATLERKIILSQHPNLFLFNLYKLGYFAKKTKEATSAM